jgi:hypothetical protein
MTFVANLDARAEAARHCTVAQERPNPFQPPATLHCAVARAINEGFWNLREATWAWTGLSSLTREAFYFVAGEAIRAAKAWSAEHGGAVMPELELAMVISAAWWAVCSEPEHRANTWDGQSENNRLTWLDCARRVLAVGREWRARLGRAV